MLLTIDDDFNDQTTSHEWRILSDIVHLFISALVSRTHLFYFSRPQVEGILNFCDLNDRQRRIISGTYLTRFNDFHGWRNVAKCIFVASKSVAAPRVDIGDRCIVHVPVGLVDSFPLLTPPQIIGEHLENDACWYLRLTEAALSDLGLRGAGIKAQPQHGGGGGVQIHFTPLSRSTDFAYCAIDADRDGPWHPEGATPKAITAAARRLRLVSDRCNGFSSLRPFFGLRCTAFRDVSSSIPPAAIKHFYESIDHKPAQLAAFSAAFPSFPILSEDEWRVWLGLNFEAPPTAAEFRASFADKISPAVTQRIADALDAAEPPRIPKNTTGQILGWEHRTGKRDGLRQHVAEAMTHPSYSQALRPLLGDLAGIAVAFDRQIQ